MSAAITRDARCAQTLAVPQHDATEGSHVTSLADPRELRHEIGNALTAAHGYAQWLLLKQPAGLDEGERHALRAIRDGVTRAHRLLSHHLPPRQSTPRDLRTIVELAAGQLPPERADDLRFRALSPETLVIGGDPDAVVQILTNLLDNAAKYSQPGTPIEVELHRIGGDAYLAVRDQGIGIEPEALEVIFNGHRTPRARLLADGQGIGLMLSRRLAREAGGHLWATSAPGQGTTFHLELPLAERGSAGRRGPVSEQHHRPRADQTPRSVPWQHVLLAVDDSADAKRAAHMAIAMARCFAARLTVLHVAVPRLRSSLETSPRAALAAERGARAAGERLLDDVRAEVDGAVPLETILRFGDPAREICAVARELDVDAIVVGGRARGRVERFLVGSVSSAVSERARCSVVVVRGDETTHEDRLAFPVSALR